MSFTVIPTVKGQMIIPLKIRKKYNIGKSTPLIVEDQGDGVITIRVMEMVDQDVVQFYDNDDEFGLLFKNGIDPQVLIDEVKKADG